MRRHLILWAPLLMAFVPAAMLVALLLSAGCGSGSGTMKGGAPEAATGRATFLVRWPERSRLIPFASESIKVSIAKGGALLGQALLVRPTNGGEATVNLDHLPTGDATVTAIAYPIADGTGVAQAQAEVGITITAGQTTPVHLTLASTIDHVEITPAVSALSVGDSLQLSATAKNTAGEVVLTSFSTLDWSSDHADIAAVEPGGLVHGAAVGAATITVTETESGKTATRALTIAQASQPIYSNDFEGDIGSEWSSQSVDVTPVGARHFLGQFSNQTVSLNLADLPTHQTVTVTFDLFVIGSWDGNVTVNQGGNQVGPDIFRLSYGSSGGELFRTTFSNWEPGSASEEVRQAYPGTVPTGDFPGRTGAAENNTLGFMHPGYPGNIQDAVYHLTITFPHTDGALQMNFGAEGLEEIANESWGIDNVQVRVGP